MDGFRIVIAKAAGPWQSHRIVIARPKAVAISSLVAAHISAPQIPYALTVTFSGQEKLGEEAPSL